MRPVGTAAELERRRLRAVQLLRQGEKPAVTTRILGLHKSTLHRWKEAVERGGGAALAARKNKRPPGLDDEKLAQLADELRKGAVAHGWANDRWTGERVRVVIQKRFGVTYSAAPVRRLLRGRMRWTSQKPERRGRGRDEAEIERGRTEEFPRLVFIDESGFMMPPTVRRTYAPCGQTPIQRSWPRHGRVSAIRAVTVSPVRRRPGLCFRLLPDHRGAKAEDTVAFLKALRRQLRGPMTVVWDQSVIHDHSRLVRVRLKRHRTVATECFPGYAPELNPDEYGWSHAKYAELCNYAAPDLGSLRAAVDDHLRSLHHGKDLLRGFIDHAHLTWDKRKSHFSCRTQ